MAKIVTLLVSLISLITLSSCTALTYKVGARERECFYATVDKVDSKVAFYFTVQQGGAYDIGYIITAPDKSVVIQGDKKLQEDLAFTAKLIGDYEICFINDMSNFAEKMIDFDITVENEQRAELPVRNSQANDDTASLESLVRSVGGKVVALQRLQKYFKAREHRNYSTVLSTESRIFYFSFFETILIASMSALQVFIVKFFFKGSRKGYV